MILTQPFQGVVSNLVEYVAKALGTPDHSLNSYVTVNNADVLPVEDLVLEATPVDVGTGTWQYQTAGTWYLDVKRGDIIKIFNNFWDSISSPRVW